MLVLQPTVLSVSPMVSRPRDLILWWWWDSVKAAAMRRTRLLFSLVFRDLVCKVSGLGGDFYFFYWVHLVAWLSNITLGPLGPS